MLGLRGRKNIAGWRSGVRIPHPQLNYSINQIGKELIIEVDDYFFKRKRLYRFDNKHINNYLIEN